MADNKNMPIPESKLQTIAEEACSNALSGATGYDHSSVSQWNSHIISSMIESLKTAATGSTPSYKFAVSATIIQNGLPGASKRGMNVSMGAFWNSETDGLWSYKYDSGEKIGLDVVVNIIWMAY